MKITRNFIQGKMDKDSDLRLIANGTYRDAQNIRISPAGDDDLGAVNKVIGNEEWVDLTQGDGSLVALGSEVHKDKIYSIMYNTTTGNTLVFEIDRESKTQTLLIEADFNHNTSVVIDDIDIVENIDGDRYMYWNDKVGDPRKFNITLLKADPTYYSSNLDETFVIKAPHSKEPILNAETEGEGYELQYKNQPQIAVQHIYEDGEESAISFYSKTLFKNSESGDSLDTAKYVISKEGFGLDDPSIYYSEDYGLTWTHSNMPSGLNVSDDMFALDMGLHGAKCYACVGTNTTSGYDSWILASVDNGKNFDFWSTNGGWNDVVCDNSGNVVYALKYTTSNMNEIGVYKRQRPATDWVELITFARTYGTDPRGIVCNEDGSVVYVVKTVDTALVSIDGGSSFQTVQLQFTLSPPILNMRCNNTGNVIYIQDLNNNGRIYVSTDYGNVWRQVTDGLVETFLPGIAIDSTGTVLYTVNDVGGVEAIRKSEDAGLTFTTLDYVPVGGTMQTIDIICDAKGKEGLVYLESDIETTGYYFDQSGVTARTMMGHMAGQGMFDTITQEDFYLKNELTGFDVNIETGSKHVEKIRILYRNASSSNFYVLDEIDKSDLGIADNSTYVYTFDKSSFDRAISENTVNKLYDNVPHKAYSQCVIGNRLIYAGYEDGRSLDIVPDFTMTERFSTPITGTSWPTMKSGTTQKYSIIYFDEYNRSSAPLVDQGGSILSFSRLYQNDFALQTRGARISINHAPPSWAVKYKIARARPIIDYRIIAGFISMRAVNDKLYIYIGNTEGQYAVGDVLEAVSYKGGGLVEENLFVYIDDVVYKDETFKEGVNSGYWIVLKPPATGNYSLGSVVTNKSYYPFTVFYLIKYDIADVGNIFYEIPGTYDIVDGVHQGGLQNQIIGSGTTPSQPALINIEDYDAWYSIYPYPIEKYRLEPGVSINNLGRPNIESERFKRINRYASLTWSDVFVPDTGYNGLSSFNLSLINYKDLDVRNGKITKIEPDYTNIIVLQDDLVSKVLVNKDVLQTGTGDQMVTASKLVLGQQVPYSGDYGCQDPLSFARWGSRKYFADKKRGVIIRLSQDGFTDVSRYGLRSEFKDILKNSGILRAAFDPAYDEYLLSHSSGAKVIGFVEGGNGWSCFYSFYPDFIFNDGYNVWSFNGSKLYRHNSGALNTFYGTQYPSHIIFSLNEAPEDIKVLHAISLHGDDPWTIDYIKDRFRETNIPSSMFENKEGYFFSYVPKAINGSDNIITDNVSTQGLGIPLAQVDTRKYRFNKITGIQCSVGDDFWVVDAVSPENLVNLGAVLSIEHDSVGTVIEFTNVPATVLTGKYCFIQKSSYVEGDYLRDYGFEIKMTHNGSVNTELFSVTAEVKQSKQ